MGAPVSQQLEPELLVRDVHPAEILIGEQLLTGVRVFVTSRRLIAYQARQGVIDKVLDSELEQPCSVARERGTLVGRVEARLADGTVALINRGHGCGCGSPLKALAPPVGWR